ncbi:MAG: sigma-54-dependent Fis family transcriptional regulator [Sedimentisphaerales bacterium]|nr:sigma-54-dependent Fis family transcriptional regulator [Sedimentisphaerales bacterium]
MALEKILVVGKDMETHQLLRPYTRELFAADEPKDAWNLLNSIDPHLILLDPHVPTAEVADFLSTACRRANTPPIVVVGHETIEEHADTYLRLGAFDCIRGKKDHNRIGHIIDRLKQIRLDGNFDARFFSSQCPSSVSIVGRSEATDRALRMIRVVARSTCNPVLIIGETGTGKELAAKAIHILRHGSNSAFVALNCAALTATLLESELFGHVKGSFTSADRDKAGLLELAGDGSIFLDEISEMPPDLQAKLLRVVQEKTFRRVGGTKDIECKATIIASSNQNLHKSVEEKRFRRDLYYRLSICPIVLSPLRSPDRSEDILLLAEYFLKNSTICPEKTGRIVGLTKLAQQSLLKHHWPGNVRELKNVIERAILLETGDKIAVDNLIIHPENGMESEVSSPLLGLKDFSLERAEKELVKRALQQAGWQKTRAAALLGITRATLYAKVKQYDIIEPDKDPEIVTV